MSVILENYQLSNIQKGRLRKWKFDFIYCKNPIPILEWNFCFNIKIYTNIVADILLVHIAV